MKRSIIAGAAAGLLWTQRRRIGFGRGAALPGVRQSREKRQNLHRRLREQDLHREVAGSQRQIRTRAAPKLPAKLKGKFGKVDIYLYNPMRKKIEGHFECAAGKETGTITSAREGTASLCYPDCVATGSLAGPCNSPGQKAGAVVTHRWRRASCGSTKRKPSPGSRSSRRPKVERSPRSCAPVAPRPLNWSGR